MKVLKLAEKLRITYVGQLISLRKEDVLEERGFGRVTLARLRHLLAPLGLDLGTQLPWWQNLTTEELESVFASEIRSAQLKRATARISPESRYLEDEMTALCAVVPKKRNRDIVARRFGLDGLSPATLQEIGDREGLTRERVRQIASSVERRVRQKLWAMPMLDRALKLITNHSPASESTLIRLLIDTKVCRGDFRIAGICAAAALTDRTVPVAACHDDYADLWVGRSIDLGLPKQISRRARRDMSASGLVSLEGLSDEFERLCRKPVSREFVGDVVSRESGFRMLDESSGWFWFPTPRNRLENTIKKFFAVAARLHVSEVRQQLKRMRRLNGFAPPQKVLLEFARCLPDFDVEGEFISRKPDSNSDAWIEGTERMLAEVLQRHGGVLDRISLEQECLARGMNEHTFMIFLHGSPLMVNLGKGAFALVGYEANPEQIEARQLPRERFREISEYGWQPDGRLRVAFRLSSNTLYTGFFSLPPPISEYVQGEFNLVSIEGVDIGRIRIKGNVGWSLRKLFRRQGGEPGDPFTLMFNLQSKSAVISFDDGV